MSDFPCCRQLFSGRNALQAVVEGSASVAGLALWGLHPSSDSTATAALKPSITAAAACANGNCGGDIEVAAGAAEISQMAALVGGKSVNCSSEMGELAESVAQLLAPGMVTLCDTLRCV